MKNYQQLLLTTSCPYDVRYDECVNSYCILFFPVHIIALSKCCIYCCIQIAFCSNYSIKLFVYIQIVQLITQPKSSAPYVQIECDSFANCWCFQFYLHFIFFFRFICVIKTRPIPLASFFTLVVRKLVFLLLSVSYLMESLCLKVVACTEYVDDVMKLCSA